MQQQEPNDQVPPALLTLSMVGRFYVPAGERTLHRWMSAGQFPKADIALGGKVRWWKRDNLRASRQTELAETYPMHVVCQWIGNTGAVAMEHYLQTLDTHFAKATAEPAKGQERAAQNPAQSEPVTVGNDQDGAKGTDKNRREYRAIPASPILA